MAWHSGTDVGREQNPQWLLLWHLLLYACPPCNCNRAVYVASSSSPDHYLGQQDERIGARFSCSSFLPPVLEICCVCVVMALREIHPASWLRCRAFDCPSVIYHSIVLVPHLSLLEFALSCRPSATIVWGHPLESLGHIINCNILVDTIVDNDCAEVEKWKKGSRQIIWGNFKEAKRR